MLTHLRIRDFAIIDDSEIEPGEGLTALTGETGAGKSILLDALGLVLGERAQSAQVRSGAARAEVTARFDIAPESLAAQWLVNNDLDDADGECVLRRVVTSAGKSRATINACPVPLTSLKGLGALLVTIHGQNAHQSLSQSAEQRRFLDAVSPHASMQATAKAWKQLHDVEKRLEAAAQAESSLQQRHDLLSFQLQEFDEANLAGLSVDSIEKEHRWLAEADRSRALGATAEHSLDVVAGPAITEALSPLTELARLDEELREALDLVESAGIQLGEAARLVHRRTSSLENDDARLAWLDDRLAVMQGLARKHRVDVAQLGRFEEELRAELDSLNDPAESVEALASERDALRKAWLKQALLLSRHRKRAAKSLAAAVTATMQQVAMEGGSFQVVVEPDESRVSHHGIDRVSFEVSPNPGIKPASLGAVASGGELSRIALALQLALLDQQDVPTLIFDEVDAGIGGAVGETVGKLLRQLGGRCQVLCVTHLAQVAAQAHGHLKVSKTVSDGRTHTQLDALDRKATREEIARMLSGKKITAKTRQHADEMLDSVD